MQKYAYGILDRISIVTNKGVHILRNRRLAKGWNITKFVSCVVIPKAGTEVYIISKNAN